MVSVVVAAAAVALAAWWVPNSECVLRIEFAGSAQTLSSALKECGLEPEAVRQTVRWDFLFIVVYLASLAAVNMLGSRAVAAHRGRKVLEVAAFLAFVAAAMDVAENVCLLIGLPQLGQQMTAQGSDVWLTGAQGMAIAKFVAVLLPVVSALLLVAIICWRALGWLLRGGRPMQGTKNVDVEQGKAKVDVETSSTISAAESRTAPAGPPGGSELHPAWSANYRVPLAQRLDDPAGGTGVCLSGGGIRSSIFAMGALQALAENNVLDRARLLATVSGGGYFGSALQGIRHRARTAPGGAHTPLSVTEAFAPGSAEEDHVRRHGKYIADGAAQWIIALCVVLRNTLLAVALAYAIIVLLAWGAGTAYVSPGEDWSMDLFPTNGSRVVPGGVWWAVATAGALALLVWVASGLVPLAWRRPAERGAAVLAGLAIGIVLICIGIPAFTAWIADITNTGRAVVSAPGSSASGPAVGVLAALVAAVTTVWNAIAKNTGQSSSTPSSPSLLTRVLTNVSFATRFLLTLAVIAALLFLAAVAFAAELRNAVNALRIDQLQKAKIGAAATFLVGLFTLFDQTRMSLHPFYKRRLASAFNIARTPTGIEEPKWGIPTTLSEYAEPLDAVGRPDASGMRLLLCAAAHTQGPALAPPGRRVVPFVFAADAIGSPKLGYFKTIQLEKATAHTSYQSDITLLAAAAVSGAAFASAMGRASGPFDKLLAVSNARLGAWLPNPRYHALRADTSSLGEELPGLEQHRKAFPRLRRLGHYVREVAGVYPADDRFVYVTDGGHYENLGLVELLRRGCTEIYCVDASGDSSLAHALAEAASLAYEELGVVITIEGMDLSTLSAVDGQEDNADLRAVHKRLARKSVVRGTFTYPPGLGPEGSHDLVFGKAVLGTDLTGKPQLWPLLAYAAAQKEFPSDSTADQWFDVDRYQGYLLLGQLVGAQMASLNRPQVDRGSDSTTENDHVITEEVARRKAWCERFSSSWRRIRPILSPR